MKMIARNHGADMAVGGAAVVAALVVGQNGKGNAQGPTSAERVVQSARSVHPEAAFREGPKEPDKRFWVGPRPEGDKPANTGMAPHNGDVVPAMTWHDKVEARKELDTSLDEFNRRVSANSVGTVKMPAMPRPPFPSAFSDEAVHGST